MSINFVWDGFGHILIEVLTALSPVLVLFLIFLLVFKMPLDMLLNLLKGVLFAFAGLALFLQGVKIGFMPVGMEIGSLLGSLPHRWVLIPLGFLLGFVATMAEPAVHILSVQVEKSSSGYIRGSIILYTLCFAVGLFIALGMTRVVYGIPFYYIIIPGYLLAIILMFFSKPSFTAIAFDSGGVATGPMTVTFIMAIAIGAADSMAGRDAVIDGFGLIALVALAPIIMVMLLGFLYPLEDTAIGDDSDPDNSADGDNSSIDRFDNGREVIEDED
ncbi:MAG: DUF1538 domain-containing protein [Dethiobacteria bacterium]|nr:DUF1538 domain-containing protein [Dethiobacteria bacterium]